MKNKQQQTNQLENTLTEIFKYEVEAGVSEYHVMIHATRPEATYEEQLNAVVDTYCQLRESELQGAVAIFKRYFLSDAAIKQICYWRFRQNVRIVHSPW